VARGLLEIAKRKGRNADKKQNGGGLGLADCDKLFRVVWWSQFLILLFCRHHADTTFV
jgi:hypothetical protein